MVNDKAGTYVIGTIDYYGEFFAPMVPSAVGKPFNEITKKDFLEVKTGDKFLIRWPNGKFTKETIRVEEKPTEVKVDMFAPPDRTTARRLVVVRPYQGSEMILTLRKGQKVRPARNV